MLTEKLKIKNAAKGICSNLQSQYIDIQPNVDQNTFELLLSLASNVWFLPTTNKVL